MKKPFLKAVGHNQLLWLQAGAVLIDATFFAYLSSLIDLMFYFFGQDISNISVSMLVNEPLSVEFFLVSISVAVIFWAINFFAFLFPLPTICFLVWNHWFFMNDQTQHPVLVTWYCFAAIATIPLQILFRKLFYISLGSRLCSVSHLVKRDSRTTTRSLTEKK